MHKKTNLQKFKKHYTFATSNTQTPQKLKIMAIRKIVAKKGNRHRQFNETEWALLGKNKNGWEQVSDITVENIIKPNTGEKKIVAPPVTGEKGKTKKPEEIVVTNSVTQKEIGDANEKNSPNDISVENNVNNSKKIEPSEETKSEFMLSLEGLTANTIKDFFDNQTPAIKYDKKAKIDPLKLQFAEHFNYDLVAKQKAFSK